MDVEVYWKGELAGRILDFVPNQQDCCGRWDPRVGSAFEQAFRAMRERVAPDGTAMLAVAFCYPDGKTQPTRALILPDMDTPFFRAGDEGDEDCVLREPTRDRDCQRCGNPIGLSRMKSMPTATMCWSCQTEVERRRAAPKAVEEGEGVAARSTCRQCGRAVPDADVVRLNDVEGDDLVRNPYCTACATRRTEGMSTISVGLLALLALAAVLTILRFLW